MKDDNLQRAAWILAGAVIILMLTVLLAAKAGAF